ncbi:homeodomain-interacting protein kinase 3-like [Dunckerocampus dactyliophorus]|uniref:homeodomain-interacting protein kinase 3-like n=1 Tax=Dunckerocampus dactyliophorus TaxID=161453 RepID=UPI0024051730|nr:homeodomain-interacting protein kinase 3-like [Dunckerocampus dactyliophorus]
MAVNKTCDTLQIYVGSILGHCYEVVDLLAEGSFGPVAKCCNTETGEMVAIRVSKKHSEVMHQAREEIAILKRLQCLDPDQCHIVRWNDFFFDKHLICLNFELLDQNLRIFQQERKLETLSIGEISPVLYQMATALLHLSNVGIVHTDIRTENIMVVDCNQQPLTFKLIDFGLAKLVSSLKPGDYGQTTCYRAPEVMLGLPYNEGIDMWSLGIVAVKLATGHHLYPGETDYEALSYIIETQGKPSDSMLERGVRSQYYFKRRNRSSGWKFKTPKEMGSPPAESRALNLKSLEEMEVVQKCDNEGLFVNLVTMMLQLDHELRVKPADFLLHPFFNPSLTLRSDDKENPSDPTNSSGSGEIQVEEQKETDIQERSRDGWLKRLFRKIQGAFKTN